MIQVRLDTTHFSKTLRNAVAYSKGFLRGAEQNKTVFNMQLAELTLEVLYRYIDSKARMNPDSLHHVYEWNMVGDESGRLFVLNAKPTQRSIWITGEFLPSKSVSESSDEPFRDKANVMENAIAIEIEPRSSGVLAFEDGNETIFTTNSIFIENPGGDEVAGSFGRAVEEFFEAYFTPMVLSQSGLIKDLQFPQEFTQFWAAGLNAGIGPGIQAGKKYMSIGDVNLA